MVFCYEYEGEYCITRNSIIKISGSNDPLIESVKKYIESEQNPEAIRSDFKLWEERGFGADLNDCLK